MTKDKKPVRRAAKSTLDYYHPLGSEDAQARMEAAVGLLKDLEAKDSDEEWDYAFKRLLRGLASSSRESRVGFSMALSELLSSRQDKISVTQYLDMMDTHFKTTKSASGHEERAVSFGILFAIETLTKSPLLAKKETTLEEFKRVIDATLALAVKKNWLRELCFFALCELFTTEPTRKGTKLESASFDLQDALEYVLTKVHEMDLTLTSEGIALYLVAPKHERASIKLDESKKCWKDNDPLDKRNLTTLAKALKEVPVDEDAKTQKGNWKPTLNFVWGKLLEQFLNASSSSSSPIGDDNNDEDDDEHKSKKRKKDKKDKKNKKKKEKPENESNVLTFDEFWRVVIDEGLLSSFSSQERKYWAFEIFTLYIQHVSSPEMVNSMLSPNLLRTVINHASNADRMLNRAAKRLLAALAESAKSKPQIAVTVIKSLLLSKSGSPNFDKLTKTKTVESIIPAVPASDLPALISLFEDIFVTPEQKGEEMEEKQVILRRNWAIDHILGLVRVLVKKTENDDQTQKGLEAVIKFLVQAGYFKDVVKATPPLVERTVEVVHQRLNSIISLTVGIKRKDGYSWSYYALKQITGLEEADKTLRSDFEGDLLAAKNKAVSTVEKVRRKRDSSPHVDNTQLEAFELLFSLVLLQVYSADADAAMILDELQLCYNSIVSKEKASEADVDDVDASQVLTEILLTFLSRQSALLRKVSETVWETFASQVSQQSLDLFFDVLNTKESQEGQREMFENLDEMDVDEDEDEENEDDEEESDDEDEESEDEESEDEESDDGDDSDESDEDKKAILEAEQAANKALAEALQVDALDEGGMDDGDDEESMDDEQMAALDEQLSAIFKERQAVLNAHKKSDGPNKKKEGKQAKQNVIQFKARVLDLLDIYIKKQPQNAAVLSIIVPLLQLMKTTSDKTLVDKAHQTLRNKLCKIKPLPVLSDEDASADVVAILEQIHEQARSSGSKVHSLACNQASVFITKVLLNFSKDTAEAISNVYAATIKDLLENKASRANPTLLIDLANWISSVKKN
ncbi:rDNA transcriptional regulator Pol5p [Trichomonascus vanleenenianus]|uniref:DNA-directed DNA polymerase n=1 Tax=Trichomonascus vanleenenianus TaxID=2268995 RepID=UPI003ECB64E8